MTAGGRRRAGGPVALLREFDAALRVAVVKESKPDPVREVIR